MKNRLFWVLLASLTLLVSSTTPVFAAGASERIGFTEADAEFYLSDQEYYFIRPGLELEITNVVIPGDLQTEVTFRLTDPAGMPLDREGLYTPGPISTSFILSFIPAGETAYVAYTTRVATSPDTGDSAIQATSDSGGTYTSMGDGEYMYKFATLVPADYDMDTTHTLGIYARRDLTEFELDRYVTNELDHFIPSGSGTATPRDVVTTETCNRCHDPLAIHGGARTDVGLCVLCHNPTQSIDPDTGDSVDMPYMTHKIHAGVQLENGYTIVGYRQSVHDYSNIIFPADINDCEICHTGGIPTEDFPMVANPNPAPACDANGLSMTEFSWGDVGSIQIRLDTADGKLFASGTNSGSAPTGKWVRDGQSFVLVDADSGEAMQELAVYNSVLGCATNQPGTSRGTAGAQHTTWMTNPNRKDCGSCHDNIDFAAGEGHIAQSNDDSCGNCHKPTGNEYDISVAGSHTVAYKSNQLPGVLVKILDISDTSPGDRPTVTFSLSDKFGPVNPDDLDRLRFSLNGPNDDFAFYVQETVTGNVTEEGLNWKFQFTERLPRDAMGSYTLGIEGRSPVLVNEGEEDEFEMEEQIQNFVEPFAVTDDMTVGRRAVVDDAKCESCHSNLTLHGTNRHNASEYCQTCHMPSATDAAVRPDDAGAPESIDFRYMIHKIHRGQELVNGYVVYGYRSSLHDYSDVEYVGDLRNCEACHDGDSYTLPLNVGLEDVTTPRDYFTPMMPETASCLSCHDDTSSASHALSNSSELGEACATCHGTGKTYSVETVHAR